MECAINTYCRDVELTVFVFVAVNSGFDAQDTIVKLQEEALLLNEPIGLDVNSGEALRPADAGIYDNYIVKKQIINSW
jgi:T-complex protein 1 subunit zeta